MQDANGAVEEQRSRKGHVYLLKEGQSRKAEEPEKLKSRRSKAGKAGNLQSSSLY